MSDVIQPMPELSPEQWDALAADILANGVLVPVVKDQHGRILDGNNRAAIAEKLGIDYPVQVVEVADDGEAWDRAVSLNCARRHLNREQTRELIRAEILRREDQSDRAISRRVGCSPSTVGAVRAEIEAQRDRQRAEERRRAEELTEQAQQEIRNELGRLTMIALLEHMKGIGWQVVGDVLERHYRNVLLVDGESVDDEPWAAMWRHVYGPFFDDVRATDCSEIFDEPCTVCTDADREWRDNHPGQVYRWRASNLDTETAVDA